MNSTIDEILKGMGPLFDRAEKEKLWFYCRYQNMWFSPKELKDYQAREQFLWGAVNWELRDPATKLEELELLRLNTGKEIIELERRVKEGWL